MINCEDINFEYLNELGGGDDEFVKEIIQTFIDDVPSVLNRIKDHYLQKNYEEIAPLAHKLKSSVMIFGLNDLTVLLKEVELIPMRESGGEKADRFIEAMIIDLEVLINCLNKELSKNRSK